MAYSDKYFGSSDILRTSVLLLDLCPRLHEIGQATVQLNSEKCDIRMGSGMRGSLPSFKGMAHVSSHSGTPTHRRTIRP